MQTVLLIAAAGTGLAQTAAARVPELPAVRVVTAVIAVAGLSLWTAACGDSTGSQVAQLSTTTLTRSSRGSTQVSGALDWTRCMRSHGVENLPDQTSITIKIPSAQYLGVSSTQLAAAENACRHLLPNGGHPPSQTEQQQQLNGMRRFAVCMRSHGLSDWPDPKVFPSGKPGFDLIGVQDANTPQAQDALHACERKHLVPTSLGGIQVEQASP